MSSPNKRGSLLTAVLILVLLAGGAFAAWYFLFRTKVDHEGAIAANNLGVGLMEQFKYEEAEAEFRKVVKNDPKWVPGRINLAIAIVNRSKGKDDEAINLLQGVLEDAPDDPHANYTLGYLLKFRDNLAAAYPYFEAVLRVDPKDAHSWLLRGICHPDGEDSPAALECFETALRLNPYLNVARHKLFDRARGAKRQALLDEEEGLKRAFWEKQFKDAYFDMGPYAEVIGSTRESHPPHPVGPPRTFEPWEQFQVSLAAGSHWAAAADLGAGPVGDLLRAVRERFGATMVLFDYNRDGKPDLFLLAAVVRDGKLGNLLLRNDGGGKFTDVTVEAGLGGESADLGCAVADFDNDDFRDLVITGARGARLLRNTGAGKFVDVSAKAGLDKLGGVCLGAGWCDLDQDSDLDLVICRLAGTPEGALAALSGKPADGGEAEVFVNISDAPAVPEGHRQPPLSGEFRRADGPPALVSRGPMVGVVFADLDDDKDVDLLFLPEGKAPAAVRNDRLMRFASLEGFPAESASWNGGLVLDVNHDGRSDLFLLPNGKRPILLLSKSGRLEEKPDGWFTAGTTNSPPLKQATAIDIDADGWTDVVGLSADREAVLLHNDGENRLVHLRDAFGVPLPADLVAVTAAGVDGDCLPHLLVWSEKEGLKALRGRDNGNKLLQLELTGRYEQETSRTNADGIGCKVTVQTGRMWTGMENTTLCAGLGQSRVPIAIGLRQHSSAEVLRVLWPDGIPQAELALNTCQLHTIQEKNRKGTSCPILLVWDGCQYRYLTDFLGGGATGESGPDGSIRPPRPEESVKVEPGLMVPKDGRLLLKIAEPMDELMYLDRLQLFAIDHPKDAQVHPDERFATSEPVPTQDLLLFTSPVHPVRATDHRGRDVTATLHDRDKKYVNGFATRSWLGYAEEHFVDLDFGDRLSKLKPGDRVFLVMAGWTDYAYPESIYAATQAGVPTIGPTLERLGDDGKWKSLGEIGFPAGLPRVMTREVTGLLDGPSCQFRIRTNLQVYWDQIVVAPLAEVARADQKGLARVTVLSPSQATLANRGFMQEIRPNGSRGPVEYDDARTETVAVTPWKGILTRLGDVTELLQKDDDQFVLCGPGDEVTVAFDATRLPPVPEGHVRSYVVRTWGYCKDTAPTTVTGGRVEPLPFRGVKNLPFFDPDERKKADTAQAEYRGKWNTRPAAGGPG